MLNKKDVALTGVYILVIILIIWAFAYFNKTEAPVIIANNDTSSTTISTVDNIDTPLDLFAKCLAIKNMTMYGAAWCSHCTAQKKLFGDSFKFVNYVECPDDVKLCTEKGINGYPTWIDGVGVKHEGGQSFSDLANITGCELPK